ncbi:MAG: tetratricopeptide repeat protein [Coriobacteriia bacterium]|nr:tetratricopeptide repeat protein [Coriobacteriia bacterium]
MALNKARTSVWMKTFIIVLIVAFISVFMAGGIAGIFELFQSSNTSTTATSTVDPVATINQQGQATVDALKSLAASQPTSYTAQVKVANAYFDWAQQLSTPTSGQSQITTAAMSAAVDVWAQARAAYDKAATLNKAFDPSVQTDRSVATFYSNDATAAIKLVRAVTVKQPDFPPAWLNLGLFYDSTGNSEQAVFAYQKYLVLDPKGKPVAYVTSRLKALGASAPATKTP